MIELGTIAVSLGAIRHNAELLARLVAPAKAAFVVKANAYGHGLLPVAAAVESSAARVCATLQPKDSHCTPPASRRRSW